MNTDSRSIFLLTHKVERAGHSGERPGSRDKGSNRQLAETRMCHIRGSQSLVRVDVSEDISATVSETDFNENRLPQNFGKAVDRVESQSASGGALRPQSCSVFLLIPPMYNSIEITEGKISQLLYETVCPWIVYKTKNGGAYKF